MRVFVVAPAFCSLFNHHANKYTYIDAGLLARSQNSEGPATGHLDTGFYLFPCA